MTHFWNKPTTTAGDKRGIPQVTHYDPIAEALAKATPTDVELARLREIEQCLTAAHQLAEEQANDPALWFVAVRASEAYLQAALRKLAAAVEGDSTPVNVVAQPMHFDPGDDTLVATAEFNRLREVEQLAKEMAARLNFVTIEWDGDDALKALIARARKMGLLE